MSQPNYSNEALDRIKKLERIRTLGVSPFATRFNVTHQIQNILKDYKKKLDE